MHHPQKSKKPARGRPTRRRLIYLGVALGLSLALVLLLPQIKRLFPSPLAVNLSGGRNFQVLDKANPQELESISVTHLTGEAYTLLYQEGRLLLQRSSQESVPIEEALEEKILEAATTIMVQDTVTQDEEEVREHLEDMGLDPAQIQVQVRYRDGRQDTLSFGWKAPETGFYYLRWSGDPGIYMCDEGVYQSFEYTARMLLPLDQVVLAQPLIDRISLRLKGQPSLGMRFATDVQGIQSAALEEPFAYPLDEAATQALLTAAAQFRLGARRDDITWENRAEHGFGDPVAEIEIHQQEGAFQQVDAGGALTPVVVPERTLRLVLGEKVGDFFYTCQYGGQYYDVSAMLVAAFLEVTPEGILSKYPANLGEAEIASVAAQVQGQVLEMRKVKTEQVLPNNQLATDASGNILYDVQVTLNGEAIAVEPFDSLVERLAAMRVSGPVGEEFVPGETTPRWQLTLTTAEGVSRTLAAYPLDAFFDAIAVDGVVRYTLQAEALEIALGELLQEN